MTYPDRNYTPSITDYIIWLVVPGLVGAFTCGIGYIILTIVWAADSNNMARANFFRAMLIIAGVGIAIGVTMLTITLGSVGAILKS